MKAIFRLVCSLISLVLIFPFISSNAHSQPECCYNEICEGYYDAIGFCAPSGGCNKQYCRAECETNDDCAGRCYGGCPGCVYQEYYCDSDCSSCSCKILANRDPDEGQYFCSLCGQAWNIGGNDNNCCGDDANENIRTRVCTSGCTSDSNDDACCDQPTDCVMSSTCYNNGDTIGILRCSSGSWVSQDCDTSQSICENAPCSKSWSIGGSADPAACCGDDSGEYKVGNTGNGGSTTCCGTASGCGYNDNCYSYDDRYANLYCRNGVWNLLDGDWDLDACNRVVGTGYWSLGGEVAGTTCCGDDSGEYKLTRTCSSSCSSDSNDDACCNSNDKCIYSSTCYSAGDRCAPWYGNYRIRCAGGSWSLLEDCSAKASTDTDGGNVPGTAGTCTDYTTCSSGSACNSNTYSDVCGSGTSLTEYYASGASCPSQAYTCANFEVAATDTDGGDNPSLNGQCTTGTAAGCSSGAFSTSSGTGSGSDQCVGSCGTGTNSCMYREFYTVDSSDACPGADSCTSKDYDADTNSNTCNTCLGAGRWNIGGITNCCGDDSGEYVRMRQCDGYACTSDANDDSCCDQTTDCVMNSVCYNSGDALPGVPGATCVSGTWKDTTAPVTSITPNGGDYTGYNVTSFTLSCADTGGSGCDKSYYKVINDGESCGTTGFTDGTSGQITCPFGQTCNKRVCFYSNDKASNSETVKQSGIFILSTNACQGKVCGEACLFTPGVCLGPNLPCYPNGGCLLSCTAPSGQTRIWGPQPNCGRTGATKCGDQNICGNSINNRDCSTGGTSTQVTGTWASYNPPSGFYGSGSVVHTVLNGVSANPSGFSILAECAMTKASGNVIYFDNWGNGNVDFPYTIATSDPEGTWSINYCGLWSDFLANSGWQLALDDTPRTFVVDKSPPNIVINSPASSSMYNVNIPVSATVTDVYSSVNYVQYRWENSTSTGPWTGMAKSGNDYTATLDISQLADGTYDITVWANDTVGNYGQAKATSIVIHKTPPVIFINSPVPAWYRSDFDVKAMVTDSIGVNYVRYRWENATSNGAWTTMSIGPDGNYTSAFAVASVSSGNYTFRVWANDTLGNANQGTVQNVGIDYIRPSSHMTLPPSGTYVMSKVFNINWTGSDAHSGIRCYYVTYKYCNQNTGLCENENNITFPDGQCTSLNGYVFDISRETWWISDPNNYTFFFRSTALDIAGNIEQKSGWETNVTIYIPKLVTFTVTESTTNANVRNGGKVANKRTVVISANAKPDVSGNLNITIFYANHTLGLAPSQWSQVRCTNTRQCNASITINVTEPQGRIEVDYYIYAENSTAVMEYLPANAPSGYFSYTVYYHYLCNFLAMDEFRTILGSNELIPIEVRNIMDVYDNVTLTLVPDMGRFLETDSTGMSIVLNPMEEKIIYARISSSLNDFALTLTGTSQSDPNLYDEDSIKVIVGVPPNFPELGDFSLLVLALVSCLIYIRFVKK